MSTAYSGAIAHDVIMSNAIKACGSIISVEIDGFLSILKKAESLVVVTSQVGIWRKRQIYMTSYKGLTFWCSSDIPIDLPKNVELVIAKKIQIPTL